MDKYFCILFPSSVNQLSSFAWHWSSLSSLTRNERGPWPWHFSLFCYASFSVGGSGSSCTTEGCHCLMYLLLLLCLLIFVRAHVPHRDVGGFRLNLNPRDKGPFRGCASSETWQKKGMLLPWKFFFCNGKRLPNNYSIIHLALTWA